MPQRRFPPWSVEDIGGSFVVKTSNDRPLVFIYYWNGIGRRSFARLLTRNTDRGEYRQAAGASAEGLICTAICPNRLIRMPEIGTLIGSGSLGVIMRVIAIHLILVGLLVVLAQPAQLAPTQAAATQTVPWHPCARITAACTRAGFAHYGAKMGFGMAVDCIRPIMLGTPQRKQATKALPQIDPEVVAACKKRNPNFGKGGRAKLQSTVQPTPKPSST